MTYEVALDDLTADAKTWDETSSALQTASSSAWAQNLATGDLSWAAEVVGLTSTYAALRAKVAGLLSEGATETGNISSTLIAVRRNYAENEQQAQHSYRGLWEPA